MDDVPDCVVGDLQLDVLMLYRRLPVQRLLRLAVARGRRAGVGRQGRVGGPPPQGPVPVLVGLMDGNGCSIGTHFLSYRPNIKASLRQHMDASKRFVLIVGDHTDSVTKGGCQWCDSYYQGYKVCDAGRYVTFVSYIEYECRMAREAGIKIVVLYNSARVNKSLCPEVIRDCGVHAPMKSRRKGFLDWDYQQVKMALGK